MSSELSFLQIIKLFSCCDEGPLRERKPKGDYTLNQWNVNRKSITLMKHISTNYKISCCYRNITAEPGCIMPLLLSTGVLTLRARLKLMMTLSHEQISVYLPLLERKITC